MNALLGRVVMSVISIVLVAWFALMAHNYWLGEAASGRILDEPNMKPGAWTNAIDDLHRAEWLDPGSHWRITRANYLLLRDTPAALRLALSVARREPRNTQAWQVIEKATAASDAPRSARAAREIRRLNPPPASNR